MSHHHTHMSHHHTLNTHWTHTKHPLNTNQTRTKQGQLLEMNAIGVLWCDICVWWCDICVWWCDICVWWCDTCKQGQLLEMNADAALLTEQLLCNVRTNSRHIARKPTPPKYFWHSKKAGRYALLTSVKRGLHSCQKRPVLVSKETYTRVERVSKEAYTSVKRGLYSCQKRPVLVSKETYTSVKSQKSVKRDLY